MGGIVCIKLGCRTIPITVLTPGGTHAKTPRIRRLHRPQGIVPPSVRRVGYGIESFGTSIYRCSTYGSRQRLHAAFLQYCTVLCGNLTLTLLPGNLSTQRVS